MRRIVKQEFMKLFMKCGVPPAVLLAPHPENIDRMMSAIEIPRGPRSDGGSAIYDKNRQQKAVAGLKEVILKDDLRSKGKLTIMSARDMDHLPNQLALSVAVFAVEHGKKFYWHSLYGGTKDDLRDDEAKAKDVLDKCGLFILSNLAENSTNIKLEKARDLLNRHSDLNRIIVTAGMNPVEYSKNVLRMRADAFIWF